MSDTNEQKRKVGMAQAPDAQPVERHNTNKNTKRCQCFPKKLDRQCGQPALRGSDFCKFHGGYQQLKSKHEPVRISPLGTKYYQSEFLGKTLKEYLEMLSEEDFKEQLHLYQELALMRATVQKSLDEYGQACKAPESEEKDSRIQQAKSQLQADLEKVAKMTKVAAYVDAIGTDKFSIHTFQSLINQMVVICRKVIGEEHIPELTKAFREHLRMPSEEIGTKLTPDRDMQEMIDSVPKPTKK